MVVGYLNNLESFQKHGSLELTSSDSVLVSLGWGPGISTFKKHPEVFLMCIQDYAPLRKICQFDVMWGKRGLQT